MKLPNTKLPSGVELSLAKHEDYEGVMDINRNVYDGVDYLPTKYNEFLNDPNRICIVAKKEGRIVGFTMFYIVDGGKTEKHQ